MTQAYSPSSSLGSSPSARESLISVAVAAPRAKRVVASSVDATDPSTSHAVWSSGGPPLSRWSTSSLNGAVPHADSSLVGVSQHRRCLAATERVPPRQFAVIAPSASTGQKALFTIGQPGVARCITFGPMLTESHHPPKLADGPTKGCPSPTHPRSSVCMDPTFGHDARGGKSRTSRMRASLRSPPHRHGRCRLSR